MSVWALPDATTIATRLIALLPGRPRRPKQSASAPGLNVPQLIRVALVLVGVAFGATYMLRLLTTPNAQTLDADRNGSAVTSTRPEPAAMPSPTRGAAD